MMRRFVDRQRAAEFAAAVSRLARERESAASTVPELIRKTPRDRWPILAERVELQTCGALECLSKVFGDTLSNNPRDAHALAELGVGAAEAIPDGIYHPITLCQIRAHAWKDLGKALRYLGRNEEALTVFDTAESALTGRAALAHDRAIVRFNRAMSLQELERFEESRQMLAECKRVYLQHGDSHNATLCSFSEGVLLQRMKKFREAREIYLLLLASTRDLVLETKAATHHAIGFCSVELGDWTDADTNLEYAIRLYKQLDQSIHILKAEIGRGRILLRRGDVNNAIVHFRLIRREFLRHGLHEEAGICGLEIVEALIRAERASQAETLARKIVREFTLANMNTRAITALGYLSDAIAANHAIPSLVVDVREYILSLRTTPEREFRWPARLME